MTDKEAFVLRFLYNILNEQTTGFLHMAYSNRKLRLACTYAETLQELQVRKPENLNCSAES